MKVCVHGLGYIGLATAALFGNNGHDVAGYDVDKQVRRRLRNGNLDISEDELAAFVRRAVDGDLTICDEPVAADYHVVCVPTPYDKETGTANLRYVKQAAETVSTLLRADDVVVLESTVPPGTTENVLTPAIAESGLEPGTDVGVGYCPETILPGNAVAELRSNDRILGGINRASTEAVEALYEGVPTGTLRTAPDATTAEFVKIVQNASRDVNIAFANTLVRVADDCDVPVRDAIELANTHPRVEILDPGPGVGGHCLPVDPHFLSDASDETALVDVARAVNDSMPGYVVQDLRTELGTLEGATVAVLGVAYKGNVADTRNSPGLAISRELGATVEEAVPLADGGVHADGGLHADVEVRLTDPLVSNEDLGLRPMAEALRGADAAIIAAAHDQYADLHPRAVGTLLDRHLIVDPVDLLDREEWRSHGFRLLKL